MRTIRNSRTRRVATVVAATIVGLMMLPAVALADHGGDYIGCGDTDTAVVEEPAEQPVDDTSHAELPNVYCSGPWPTYGAGGSGGAGGGEMSGGVEAESGSGGRHQRGRLLAAGCRVTGGGAADSEAGYWNDSATADLVDSAPADLDEMNVAAAGSAGWSRTAVAGCPRPVALVGGTGGVVAPNRIDAGGGGVASGGNTAALGGVLLGAASAAAAVVARRRRRA